jgi:iron(III) transport system ATP-binding protein
MLSTEPLRGTPMPQSIAAQDVPARIRVHGLTKRYRTAHGGVVALSRVSLDVGPGEKVVLLGPSGCGKTTLLRSVAGLEMPDEGEIEIDGRVVFSSARGIFVPPEERGISMVFQSYALWPHMTVFDNVAYPLLNLRTPKPEIRERVMEALRLTGCEPYAARYPSQLSGGQQQRISLARAIVGRDRTVLFDEPLSNVDAQVREQLRNELVTLQRKFGFSALYVTHDQSEALALAHRIAVMETGRVAQIGKVHEIYRKPASRYVAEFTGAANSFPGRVTVAGNGEAHVETELGLLRASGTTGLQQGQEVVVVIRPEHIHVSAGRPAQNGFEMQIDAAMFLGVYTEYVASRADTRITVRSTQADLFSEGRKVWGSAGPANIIVFPGGARE